MKNWKKVDKKELRKTKPWVDSEYYIEGKKDFILVYYDELMPKYNRWLVAVGTTVANSKHHRFRSRKDAIKFVEEYKRK